MPDLDNTELTRTDQCLVSSDFKLIVDDDLKSIIQSHLKKDATLFALIDSCFSGSALDLRYVYNLDRKQMGRNVKDSETIGNVIMISGCSDTQTSSEAMLNGSVSGVLTNSFCNTELPTTWYELIHNLDRYIKSRGFKQSVQLSFGKESTNQRVIL